MDNAMNIVWIFMAVGVLFMVCVGVSMFLLGRALGRVAVRVGGDVVAHTGEGVGKGIAGVSQGVGESLESLSGATGNSLSHVSKGIGDSMEYVAERGGRSVERLAESCRRVVGQLYGIREDIEARVPQRMFISFRVRCEDTQSINEWATSSKEITVSHNYEYKSLLGMVSIRQEERFVIKAGIPLNAVCVEVPEEGDEGDLNKEVVYHVPRAAVLSCTAVPESFETKSSTKVWQSISDDRRKMARDELLKAAYALAAQTDVLVVAENNVRDYLVRKHESMLELSGYGCVVRNDVLPAAFSSVVVGLSDGGELGSSIEKCG